MPDHDINDLRNRINGALDYVAGGGFDTRESIAWHQWQLDHMQKVICIEHLPAPELAVLVAALGPIFARLISQPPEPERTQLRSVS